jgi:hypothetical protein
LRSRAVAALLAGCAAAAAATAVVGAADERSLAFTTNVRPMQPVVTAQPGEEACQVGVEAVADFDTLELLPGTGRAAGPPLVATVRTLPELRVLATGRLPAGARDNRSARLRLDRAVERDGLIEVCLRNAGRREVAFYGGPTIESQGHSAAGGRLGTGDMRIVFLRGEPRSALAQVPDMFERATRFRPDVVGEWTFWVLLVLVAGGIPALLAAALRWSGGSNGPA